MLRLNADKSKETLLLKIGDGTKIVNLLPPPANLIVGVLDICVHLGVRRGVYESLERVVVYFLEDHLLNHVKHVLCDSCSVGYARLDYALDSRSLFGRYTPHLNR